MSNDPNLIRIIIDRLNKEAWRYALPFLGDVLIGILEDIDAARDKRAIYSALNEVREEVATLSELLEHPRIRMLLGLGNYQPLEITAQSAGIEETITNLVEVLKDPFGSNLNPKLEAAIETQALSPASLVSVEKLGHEEDLGIRIGDLELGKLFYPFHFIGERFQSLGDCKDSLETFPLNALFDADFYRGYPRWICIEFRDDILTLTAYPAPIKLDSERTGEPIYMDRLSIEKLDSSAKCEYWPSAGRGPKFILEIRLEDPVKLSLWEKGIANPAILAFEFMNANVEDSRSSE